MKQVTEPVLRRQLANLCQALARTALDDAEEFSLPKFIDAAENALYNFAEDCAVDRKASLFGEASERGIKSIKREGTQGKQVPGRATGISSLDREIQGLRDGDLIILAGPPGVGKTRLATSIAFNVASRPIRDFDGWNEASTSLGVSVAYFCLKMNADQLALRILAEQTGLDLGTLYRGEAGEGLHAMASEAQRLANLPLYIDDNPAPSIIGLHARARTLKRRHDIGLIIVDCVQLVRPPSCSATVISGISEICRRLKILAAELSLPVIALFEIRDTSEACNDEDLEISEVTKRGRFEADADQFWLLRRRIGPDGSPQHNLHSAAQAELRAEDHGLVELIVASLRHGVVRRVTLQFNVVSGRSSDPSGEGE